MRNVADWPDVQSQKSWEKHYSKEYLYDTWARQCDFYIGYVQYHPSTTTVPSSVHERIPRHSLMLEYLPKCTPPTLIIDSRKDTFFPDDGRQPIEMLIAQLPNAKYGSSS